eukprot:comp6215_c0_seq1/m.2046 comp6215_c0_seq1/g.2046  ORF comp6215_c0_seq1/g.2046 comp6215_c0_seq1/m.2046 type:complete len:218 (-) comp6215_c0_seq1:558-1211(-)
MPEATMESKARRKSSDLSCLNSPGECIGKSFVLTDGAAARVVSVCGDRMWGKLFLSYLTLENELASTPAAKRRKVGDGEGFRKLTHVRPSDLVETDDYREIKREYVVEECRIVCVDDPFIKQEMEEKGTTLKTFFFSWYFCRRTETLYPYDFRGRAVRVLWPEDKKQYSGVIRDVSREDGRYCIQYDVDKTQEWVNLVSLREQNSLEFVGEDTTLKV